MSFPNNKRGPFFLLLSFIVFFGSCKKESRSSLDELSASMSGLSASYVENGTSVTLNGQVYHFTPDYVGVPVRLNKVAGTGDTVFATVDTSLISSYNQLFSENNPVIPGSAFGVSNNGAFPIEAGATQAADSLYAVLKDASLLTDSGLYVVPVRLKEKTGAGLQTSIVFFKMRVRKYDSLVASIDATLSYPNTTPQVYKGGVLFSYLMDADANGVISGFTQIKVGIKLNAKFFDHDLKVSASLINDSASIRAYGSYYVPFPQNSCSLGNAEVTIPAGSLYGKDSIVMNIQPQTQFKLYASYLTMINLQQDSDAAHAVPLLTGQRTADISLFAF